MALPGRRLRVYAAIVVALLSAASAAVSADGYPHVALYWYVHGDGMPLVDPTSGTLFADVADDVSRYQQLVVDANPIAPYRPDLLDSLRRRNPDLRILAFVTGHCIWPADNPDSLHHYPTLYWRTVRDLDGFLYNRDGELYGQTNFAFANVNLAKRDSAGRYLVAEAVARVMFEAAYAPAAWDGLFVDTYCDHVTWTQTPSESIDFVRAGYPDLASFDDAWKAGTDTLASRLRMLVGPSAILVGNCAQGTKYSWFNGWMRENFPFQNGGTWYSNMFRDPGGYLAGDLRFRAPTDNLILSMAYPPSEPYSAETTRRVRFALASAALGDGYACLDVTGRVVDEYAYGSWWYDEYAVDLETGASSPSLRHTGWLGDPLAPWYRMIWVAHGADAVVNPDLERDATGWSLSGAAPPSAELTRDTTTAGAGGASLRVHAAGEDLLDSTVDVVNDGLQELWFGGAYSASFRAKASSPRPIEVVAGLRGATSLAHATVTLDTDWRRYQVTLQPLPSGPAQLQFDLGRLPGDVWFDDAHLQAGITMVYRRDFQHGIVLVNPGPAWAWVPLERAYRRIRGTADPVTNDGSTVYWAAVPANDAVFLVDPLVVLDAEPVPAPLGLHLGIPNPSTPGELRVRFVLPRSELVGLELYDVRGRRLAHRSPERRTAGSQTLTWPVGDLASGVYFVRLAAGASRCNVKWVVVR
jgi:hypothetical protein